MFVEYAGLTQEASTLIERLRRDPSETKSDILVRVLSPIVGTAPSQGQETYLDLGQGARLRVGERAYLFLSLSEDAKRNQPDAVAQVYSDGLHLDGKLVEPSNGSFLHPAMRVIQKKSNHRNEKGEIISLSAWRQWHVERDGHLVPVFELKDRA